MKKSELVNLFAEACKTTKKDAEEFLARFGDILAAELIGGGEAPLPGVGKLMIKEAKARTGRNPRTGKAVQIPARRKVVLKVGKELKDSLN